MITSLVYLTGPKSHTFSNAANSEGEIRTSFIDKRGIYIWTQIATGYQYVGSSKNLSKRLGDYYQNSYLNTQKGRGSAIARALLTHGHNAFSVQVVVLGPSLDVSYSSDNLPDYVSLEQYYLDSYVLIYNMNRFASSAAYVPGNVSVNTGALNVSFGRKGEDAIVWGRTHSAEMRELWSQQRGSIVIYLYDRVSLELVKVCPSGQSLSAFLGASNRNYGLKLASELYYTVHGVFIYGDYIVSLAPHTHEELLVILPELPARPAAPIVVYKGQTMYGFNPTTKEYMEWPSKEECTKFLTGRPYANKKTVNRRINQNLEYNGWLLQTTPFSR